ncbi:MAG: PA14 domain-containing protein [Desulfobulbaceae bacterium]|nr:PA14 domain-containing protein [Desulfobulbaceae bacterium]
MENIMRKKIFYAALKIMVPVLAVSVLWGCAALKHKKEPLVVGQPQHPAGIEANRIQPGLSVLYFYDLYRYMYQMPKGDAIIRKGTPGPPILQLNHRFGDGKVFDSGVNKGVGMVMTGYLHLEQPGPYAFQAKSNDGFELYINDNLLISDPAVHGDKVSEPGLMTAAEGGWFPVMIKYFQRKGTATLELYWKPPGAESFAIIPPEVYGHQPEQ